MEEGRGGVCKKGVVWKREEGVCVRRELCGRGERGCM